MERDTYRIVRSGDGWVLRLNGQLLESFETQDETERAAKAAARLSRRRGRLVEIIRDDRDEDASPSCGNGSS